MRPRVTRLEIILANLNGDDRTSLQSILQGTPWAMIDAGLPQIETAVREASVPIVLCDRDDCDYWREMIRTLMKARRDVCVILLSREGDAACNEDVARYGGFDLLTKPLRREQVLPMLLFAYTYCRGHGPYLSRPRRMQPARLSY